MTVHQLIKQEKSILTARCGIITKLPKNRTGSLAQDGEMSVFGFNCKKCIEETESLKTSKKGIK